MEKKLSKGKKQLINILVVVALIGITFAILFSSNELSLSGIAEYLRACNPWLIVAAFGCMLLFIAFEGFSIFLICRKIGYKAKLSSSMIYSSADVYYSALTPSASGGQPASAFYMAKDGIDVGGASFALVVNLIAYTAAILILGVFAFIVHPEYFVGMSVFSKVLVILGMVVQTILLLFFIACITFYRAVLKVGNGLISLLVKIKIVKKEEKWRNKLASEVDKYHHCFQELKKHKLLFLWTILLNVAQRSVQICITCFVCLAAAPEISFLDVFVMQAYILVGYNCIPLPGGSGAYEVLSLDILTLSGITYPGGTGVAMMVSRTISYYLCIVVSGVMTLSYHIKLMRKGKQRKETLVTQEEEITKEKEDEELV